MSSCMPLFHFIYFPPSLAPRSCHVAHKGPGEHLIEEWFGDESYGSVSSYRILRESAAPLRYVVPSDGLSRNHIILLLNYMWDTGAVQKQINSRHPSDKLAWDCLFYGLLQNYIRVHAIFIHEAFFSPMYIRVCRIWGSHSDNYEEFCILGYNNQPGCYIPGVRMLHPTLSQLFKKSVNYGRYEEQNVNPSSRWH
jgi:hypothetical protein